MEFIGQTHFRKELDAIWQRMVYERKNFNLLFRAPSGYGKTNLALRFVNHTKDFQYIISSGPVKLNLKKEAFVIDEAHLIKEPELLYPFMDSGKYTFIFCTNESGILKEPLINRCMQFIFKDYTKAEMKKIIKNVFISNGIRLPQSFIEEVERNSQRNPRIATQLCLRLINLFQIYGFPGNIEGLHDYINNLLNIHDGMTELHERYLEYLSGVGTASLESISYGVKLDIDTIKKEVEPLLISRNLIKISSRGRSVV